MAESRYTFALRAKSDDLAGFTCQNQIFTDYLQQHAGQDMRPRATTIILLRELGKPEILGFYTIGSFGIALTDLPDFMQKRLPRYPMVSAELIGRLALDRRYEGHGLGQLMLVDALSRSAGLGVTVWGVVVDAIDQAAVTFYQKFGFIVLEDEVHRLILPIEAFLKATNQSADRST